MKNQISDSAWRSGLRARARVPARQIAVIAAIGLLAGCAAGPDYARPEVPASKGYSSVPLPAATASAPAPGGTAQRFVVAQDIQADWWRLFQSPQLNTLIEKGFAASPTIGAAHAALLVAQENVRAQRGYFFPTVKASYSPERTKIAGNLGGNSPGVQADGSDISTFSGTPASEGGEPPFNGPVTYNFHTAQLTVGFVPDVFGGNRRQVEALQSEKKYQKFQLEAAYITLASNIAAAAIQDALLRRQIATTNDMVTANAAAVELATRQFKSGYASRLDLAVQDSALAQAKQLLPPLKKQFEQNRNLLRALTGNVPDSELPEFDLDSLKLPEELPLSLPSQLVEQRPDVRSAEEQLHAASAQVGIARANRLPQFSIDATVGGAASHFSQMFWPGGQFFSLMAGITQPIFAGGTLLHRERAAREGLRQAAFQYQATIITAFQNVADTLHAIHADADALKAATEVVDTTKIQLDLTRRQYTRGYLDRLALLVAEQAYRQALLNMAQAQATRLGDTAALFQSLGGGWWHRDPKASAMEGAGSSEAAS